MTKSRVDRMKLESELAEYIYTIEKSKLERIQLERDRIEKEIKLDNTSENVLYLILGMTITVALFILFTIWVNG